MCSCYGSVIGHPYPHCYDTLQNDRVRLVDNDFLANLSRAWRTLAIRSRFFSLAL